MFVQNCDICFSASFDTVENQAFEYTFRTINMQIDPRNLFAEMDEDLGVFVTCFSSIHLPQSCFSTGPRYGNRTSHSSSSKEEREFLGFVARQIEVPADMKLSCCSAVGLPSIIVEAQYHFVRWRSFMTDWSVMEFLPLIYSASLLIIYQCGPWIFPRIW